MEHFCKTCKHRDEKGYCGNEKISEDYGQSNKDKTDMLIYDYSEGGGFWVGQEFGCVHHIGENMQNQKPSDEAIDLARELAERWWQEGKLSYNWHPIKDVEFLALVIETKNVPNAEKQPAAPAVRVD